MLRRKLFTNLVRTLDDLVMEKKIIYCNIADKDC